MGKELPPEVLRQFAQKHPEYAPEAGNFVAEAVSFTVGRLPQARHVTGAELLVGVRDLAQEKFGPLGAKVLAEWGIAVPLDIGKVVYFLIESGVLCATAEDKLEDFDLDFDFSFTAASAGMPTDLPIIAERK